MIGPTTEAFTLEKGRKYKDILLKIFDVASEHAIYLENWTAARDGQVINENSIDENEFLCIMISVGRKFNELLELITDSKEVIHDETIADWLNKRILEA